ncbi:hypothetical protein MCOR14_009373 [Pyricularia oryzae]|uniref:Uncharacterized protein n=1 Tax=Pyricularia oryzae TaxID=318829 RepID=A0A4P7MTH1_PYROR|nr:hypothetical protein MCOR13_010069 [Pyricularia oryzae]KAI6624085.1 hypothetical protein MCOR14_009373 [Pyricularia oryzae]QBZ53483.1 hypothetical protein PoMZ_09163 [Pyricularia oryzae]
MFFTRLATLTVASLMVSPITAGPINPRASSGNGQAIGESEVAVNTPEGVQMMSHSAYVSMLQEKGIQIGAPPPIHDDMVTYNAQQLAELEASEAAKKTDDAPPPPPGTLDSRGKCDKTTSVVIDNTTTFVDWDAQMSPVVCAQGNMMVAVASGYMVSNSIGVNAGLMPTMVKDVLSGSLNIDYTRSWTTSSVITTTGTVTDKNCGVMVTRPIVTRRTGRVFKGCLGALEQIGSFYADDHKEVTIAGMKWVEGAISMCMKPGINPPLSRCSGEGNFI